MTIPNWLIGASCGHCCGASFRVNADGSVDQINGPVTVVTDVATVAVSSDESSAYFVCPTSGCGKDVTFERPDNNDA
jgi:hypothetical protein